MHTNTPIIVEGPCGIYAKVLKDSVNSAGIRLLTFEISYPRIILSELNTHKMLSKNSASSRAIPFTKMKEQLTGRPVRFGEANPGMQDKGEDFEGEVRDMLRGQLQVSPVDAWESAKIFACQQSEAFCDAGYHKQVYNRLTEPFQMMKTVISGTEWNNFFWLRDDEAADPTIAALAKCMREAAKLSTPDYLPDGAWHLPYVESRAAYTSYIGDTIQYYIVNDAGDSTPLDVQDAIEVSAARCAAVSFRNVDYTLEKSLEVYERLVGADRKHASAFEHQATPIEAMCYSEHESEVLNIPCMPRSWQPGVTHMDKNEQLWSANFRGFVQYRKLIHGENKEGFEVQ